MKDVNAIMKKGKLNSEMIWKMRKKSKLKCEMIWKIWKKSKLECDMIWKIWNIRRKTYFLSPFVVT
jgi:hypothetical protein